jgi:hypothetical protein
VVSTVKVDRKTIFIHDHDLNKFGGRECDRNQYSN